MDSLSTKIERAEGRWTVTFFSKSDLVAVSTFDTEDEAVRIACRILGAMTDVLLGIFFAASMVVGSWQG